MPGSEKGAYIKANSIDLTNYMEAVGKELNPVQEDGFIKQTLSLIRYVFLTTYTLYYIPIDNRTTKM